MTFFTSFVLNFKRFVPQLCKTRRFCCCCRETPRERMFNRGLDKFRNEIEITNLLKTMRYLRANAKKGYSKIQWRLFKLQAGIRQLHLLPKQDKVKEDKFFKAQPFTGKASREVRQDFVP